MPICPIFEQWIPNKAWDPAWGDPEASPEPMRVEPDEARCMRTDRLIMMMCPPDRVDRVRIKHVITIKRKFYNRREVPWEDLQAAVRAFNDLLTGITHLRIVG